MMRAKKIAIIGTGISGLTCGYYLANHHEVTIYESGDYIGGHTHTIAVEKGAERSHIDTGFIVFNDQTYPNFIKLLKEIGVHYQPTEMSFSVRNDQINLEYNGHTVNTVFAQRFNLWRPKFWRMLRDIIHFNRDVRKRAEETPDLSVGEYLNSSGYSSLFRDNYVLPMISAIWSMGLERSMALPLLFFVRFFENHGLLNMTQRPQWYTIVGGSSSYIWPLTKAFRKNILLNTPVARLTRKKEGVYVYTDKRKERYDEVIVACHGDQALALLDQPTDIEKSVLENFRFSDNTAVLHTDVSHLPKRKKVWASWNYRMVDAARERSVLTYNMNILQCLQKQHTYLVSLNQAVEEKHVIKTIHYTHPIFTAATVRSQQHWDKISGADRIHYCGAYWFNGFHEDGVRSGLRVCRMLGRNI